MVLGAGRPTPGRTGLLPARHRKPAADARATVAAVQTARELQPLLADLQPDHGGRRVLHRQSAKAAARTAGPRSDAITDGLPAARPCVQAARLTVHAMRLGRGSG